MSTAGQGLATSGDRHPIHGRARNYSVMDRVRAQELTRRMQLGESPTQAWAKIVADPEIGYSKHRGRTTPLKAGKVQRSLERFVARAVDEESRAALNLGRIEAAKHVPEAITTTAEIMRGNFGEGKVSIKGRGDNAEEVVEVDGAAAAVRLKAARMLLEINSVMPRAGASPTNVNVSQTNNTGVLMVPTPAPASDWVAQVEAENATSKPPNEARDGLRAGK